MMPAKMEVKTKRDPESAQNESDRPDDSVSKASNMSENKGALALAVGLFLILSALGITFLLVFEDIAKDRVQIEALSLARESGNFFSEQLDRALLPLFSLAQFATELDLFRDLAKSIGSIDDPDRLPFLEGSDGTSWLKRNITGVCDDPVLVSRFTRIASNIKKSAKMEGILVNLQFAPSGVLCLLHPMNNTEDFPPGVFMDSSSVWGLDLLNDPAMSFIARKTVTTEDVVVAGPRKLMQCNSGEGNCDALVEQALIARLPIAYPGYNITIDGVDYPRWGFTTALINWANLANESRIFESFTSVGMHFQLTRTDRILNFTSGTYDVTKVILAESRDFDIHSEKEKRVVVPLKTTNNQWEMTVVYVHPVSRLTHGMIIGVTIFVSAMIGFLVYLVLLQKHAKNVILRESASRQAHLEAERRITAYFAHELRNPLGAIICALEALPDDLPASVQELFDCMTVGSRFMSYIMDNLVEGRKIEEGKMQLELRPISLTSILTEVYNMLKPSVVSPVRFEMVCSTEGRDHVYGDEHRIKQILSNITTNAIKYTKSGLIKLSVHWEGTNAVFECVDDGLGIPKEKQQMLFQRFVQLGDRPGSGLGLAISKQLVDLMNGTIVYESDPNVRQGTKCTVTLPLAPAAKMMTQQASEPSTSTSDSSEAPALIMEPIELLIVDDVSMNRSMLTRRFQKCIMPNANITSCATGEAAIALCAKKKFDVIIMDQYMESAGGKLKGSETVAQLRKLDAKDSIIIGCSGNATSEVFGKAGTNLVWSKPLPSNAEILSQIRSEMDLLTG